MIVRMAPARPAADKLSDDSPHIELTTGRAGQRGYPPGQRGYKCHTKHCENVATPC
jgi:hypothetical protein